MRSRKSIPVYANSIPISSNAILTSRLSSPQYKTALPDAVGRWAVTATCVVSRLLRSTRPVGTLCRRKLTCDNASQGARTPSRFISSYPAAIPISTSSFPNSGFAIPGQTSVAGKAMLRRAYGSPNCQHWRTSFVACIAGGHAEAPPTRSAICQGNPRNNAMQNR